MRSLRRPTRSTIHYHGRTDDGTEHTVTISINGIRWEYWVTPQVADTVEYLARQVSAAKALVHAKKNSNKAECHNPSAAMSTLLRHRGAQASRAKRMKVTLPNV